MSSFNPLAKMMPNQKDNTIRLSAKEKKAKEAKKKEISGQLKLTHLRDKLLDLSLSFLTSSELYFDNGVFDGQNSKVAEN